MSVNKRRKRVVTSPLKENRRDERFVSAMILGDNHGYRMKSYGPLPLVSFHDKTLLEHQVDAIKAVYRNYEIILCCGFQSDKVFKFVRKNMPLENIRIVENQIYNSSNDAESARICLNNTMNDNVVIIDGSVAVTPECLKEVSNTNNCIVTQPKDKESFFEIGVVDSGGVVQNMSVGQHEHRWVEVVGLTDKHSIEVMQSVLADQDYKTRLLFEAVNDSIDRGVKFVPSRLTDYTVMSVNNIKSFRKIQQ